MHHNEYPDQLEVLTPAEAAELLRLNVSQLYSLTSARSQSRAKRPLPYKKLGTKKHLRFLRSELMAWLREGGAQ